MTTLVINYEMEEQENGVTRVVKKSKASPNNITVGGGQAFEEHKKGPLSEPNSYSGLFDKHK